jgi:hypothetical protein
MSPSIECVHLGFLVCERLSLVRKSPLPYPIVVSDQAPCSGNEETSDLVMCFLLGFRIVIL